MIFHQYNYHNLMINKDLNNLIYQKVIMKILLNNHLQKEYIQFNNVILI